jgi:hypothetical protein
MFAAAAKTTSSTPAWKTRLKENQAKTLPESKPAPEPESQPDVQESQNKDPAPKLSPVTQQKGLSDDDVSVSISSAASDDSPLVKTSTEPQNLVGKTVDSDSDDDSDSPSEASSPVFSPVNIQKATAKIPIPKYVSTQESDAYSLKKEEARHEHDAPTVLPTDLSSSTYEENLRKQIKETAKTLDSIALDTKIELGELKKKFTTEQDKLRLQYNKKITAERKVSNKQDKEHQKAVDREKEITDNLRAENKRLRATQEKIPKQMKETLASSRSLESANEEVAGHFEQLNAFAKKSQADHDRLVESSRACKDEYLPRYRHELWERQIFLDSETRIKTLYRDCGIEIAKHVEKSRQPDLIEEISTMVLETDAEINPKFDPKLIFANDSDSDSDSDATSDCSSSSSNSDSDSD